MDVQGKRDSERLSELCVTMVELRVDSVRVRASLDGKLVQTCISLLKSDLSYNLLHHILFFSSFSMHLLCVVFNLQFHGFGTVVLSLGCPFSMPGMGSGVSIF